jgi:hypothetical protein
MDTSAFAGTAHGRLLCQDCHGGDGEADDKRQAHADMVRDPSSDAEASCGACHPDIVEANSGSLHRTLQGYETMVEARLGEDLDDHPAVVEGMQGACYKCHATCGQCHVSRPESVGGGLTDGHVFQRTPDMLNQCTACHGSRIGEEFRGVHRDEIDGYKGDVHYLASMRCQSCHGAMEIHGSTAETRHEATEMPKCEDCHGATRNTNEWHLAHWDDLSCQVCHSQDYKSCASCHVPDGVDEPSWLGFKIGRNPLPDQRRQAYVTLRHIPVAPDTFAAWGVAELPAFEALPTWKYTSPHNIVLQSERTTVGKDEACGDRCHNSPATTDGWFLRQTDLDQRPELAEANTPFIVPDTPATEWWPDGDTIAPPRSKETP